MKNFYSFPYSLMHIRPSKYTETTFYMVLCCLYCYLATYFLLSSTVFIVDFEHLNDGQDANSMIFNNPYTSDHQYFKKPDKDAFFFKVAFQSIPNFSGIYKKKLFLKFCSNK